MEPIANPLGRIAGEIPVTSREKFPYADNQTASYVPNLFLGHGKPSLPKALAAFPVEDNLYIPKPDTPLLPLTKKLKDDIQNAVETRFQLFSTLLAAVHRANLIFKKAPTDGQAGQKKGNKIKGLALAEAHAATVPTLYYTTKEEERSSMEDPDHKLKLFVFDKDNRNRNLTHKLPTYVNECDTRIDEKTKLKDMAFDNFRAHSITILNYCSNDGVTPQKCMVIFLTRFIQVTNAVIEKKEAEQEPSTHKIEVLQYYREVAEKYLAKRNDLTFWKRLFFSTTPGDINFDTLQGDIFARIRFNAKMYEKYESIKTACKDLICLERQVTTVQNLDTIVKCLLHSYFAANGTTAEIEGSLDEITGANSPLILRYAYQCLQDKALRTSAIETLDADETETLLELSQKQWKTMDLGKAISNELGKTPQNFHALCVRVLHGASLLRQTAGPQSLALYKFICLDRHTLFFLNAPGVVAECVDLCKNNNRINLLCQGFLQEVVHYPV